MSTTLNLSLTASRATNPTFSFPITKAYAITEPVYQEIEVPITVPTTIPLGGLTTAKVLVLSTTGAISLTANFGAGVQTIPVTDMMALSGNITALTAVSTGTATVTVSILLAGL